MLPPQLKRSQKFFMAALMLWLAGFILIFVPGVTWWYVIGCVAGGATLLTISSRIIMRSLKGPAIDVTKCDAFPTAHFSDSFHQAVKEAEEQTGKRVHILDSRSGHVPEAFRMPGAGPPPVYASPDFSQGIMVFATPDLFTDDETEASIIKVLTMTLLSFEGFLEVRPDPRFHLAAMTAIDRPDCVLDATAIQQWFHQGLLGLVVEERLAAKGFTSRTMKVNVIRRLEEDLPLRLLGSTSKDIILGIELALTQLEQASGVIPAAWASRVIEAQRKVEVRSPRAVEHAKRIVATVQQHRYSDPVGFTDCFKAELGLWGLQDAVAFGRRDKRTGEIVPVR